MPTPKCLNCGQELDGAASLETDNAPRSGDLSVCIYCAHVAMFIEGGNLRELTDEERKEAFADNRITRMIMDIAGIHDDRPIQ
jgi:hypothetical protein